MHTTEENLTPALKLVKSPKVKGTESLSFAIDTDDYSIDQLFLDAESYVDPIEEKTQHIQCADWQEYKKRQQEIMGRMEYYLGELKDHLL